MSNNLYMPLYVNDYLTDAAHLNAAEHGAYMLLIMNYWQRGEPLPADDRKLSRIARMTDEQWASSRDMILEFFEEVDGQIRHGRIDAELDKAREKSSKARNSANARVANAQRPLIEGLSNKDKDKEDKKETTSDDVVAQEPAPKPSKSKRKSSISPDAQLSPEGQAVAHDSGMPDDAIPHEWRRFVDHHVSRGNVMADWPAAWRTWISNWHRFGKSSAAPRLAYSSPQQPLAFVPTPRVQNTGMSDEDRAEMTRISQLPLDERRDAHARFLDQRRQKNG